MTARSSSALRHLLDVLRRGCPSGTVAVLLATLLLLLVALGAALVLTTPRSPGKRCR